MTADRTAEQRRIDVYADDVARHLAAGPAQRARRRAEIAGHLADAAEAGELDAALARLGNPRDAARQFTAPAARLAPIGRRLAAAAIDNMPLIAVAVALAVHGALRVGDGGAFTVLFPPVLYVEVGGLCLTLMPIECGAGLYPGAGALAAVGIPLALIWSISFVGELDLSPGCLTAGRSDERPRGLGFWVNAATTWDAERALDPRPALRTSRTPVLVMRAECDYIAWEVTREYRDVLPDTTLVAIEGSGHGVASNRPDVYSGLTAAFLLGQPLGRPGYTGSAHRSRRRAGSPRGRGWRPGRGWRTPAWQAAVTRTP